MAVAKSFQNFEFLTEPYTIDGKAYIKVRNPKTGTERQVRWYEEKTAPKAKVEIKVPGTFSKPQKDVLGFTKGYITIFKGDVEAHEDWFRASIARYAKWWGWYIISTDEIPEDLPIDIEPIQLKWELVGNDNGVLKMEKEIQIAVESLLYAAGDSEFVGKIGDRIEVEVTVIKALKLENDFGGSVMHLMEDNNRNVFVWITSAKSWAEGSVKRVRGTVKDHRIYKGVKQNILTMCIER